MTVWHEYNHCKRLILQGAGKYRKKWQKSDEYKCMTKYYLPLNGLKKNDKNLQKSTQPN